MVDESSRERVMKISVFGLGYVGTVSAGCLAASGHSVWGVDVNADKVASINSGSAPIVEPEISDFIAKAQQQGLLKATVSSAEGILQHGCLIYLRGDAQPSQRQSRSDAYEAGV